MRYDNILQAIGRTPLVRLNRVARNLNATLWGKCEFLNPGGSVKDRIAYQMIQEAEKSGRIRRGDTIIEPTSGNTGIGLALAGAALGYRVIIVMPEKMSREKQVVLEALGAEVIRTPTEAAWDAPESHIETAKRLAEELPHAHLLDQYANPANPGVHFEATGQEIWDDLEGKVDMVIIGAGTGGTITGVSRKLKELNPNIEIVGVDPYGSILAGVEGEQPGVYKVEGIGYDFVPDVLDRGTVDWWIKSDDRNSFLTARRLIREEGLLVGGSSGTAVWAALQAAADLPKGANAVVLLPDGVRNYMSKFVDDAWMRQNHFHDTSLSSGRVEDLLRNTGELNKAPLITVQDTQALGEAVKTMRQRGISQLPVVRDDGTMAGVLSEGRILNYLAEGGSPTDGCGEAMDVKVPRVTAGTTLSTLHETVMRHESAIVVDRESKPLHIVTRIDLLDYITLTPRDGDATGTRKIGAGAPRAQ